MTYTVHACIYIVHVHIKRWFTIVSDLKNNTYTYIHVKKRWFTIVSDLKNNTYTYIHVKKRWFTIVSDLDTHTYKEVVYYS